MVATTGITKANEPQDIISATIGESTLAESYKHLGENLTKKKQEELLAAIVIIGEGLFVADREYLAEAERLKKEYEAIANEQAIFKHIYPRERESIEHALAKRLNGKTVAELIAEAERLQQERATYGDEQYEIAHLNRTNDELSVIRNKKEIQSVREYAASLGKIKKALPDHKKDEFEDIFEKFLSNSQKNFSNPRYYFTNIKVKEEIMKFAKGITVGQQLDVKTVDELIATIVRLNNEGLGE